MIIYWQELKRNRRSFIIWTVISVLLIVSQLTVFPNFYKDSVASQEQLINKYPEALVESFGLSKLDMSDILNYFAVKIVPLVGMFGGIFSMILGSSILSREISEKTIEFLLSKPISRSSIIREKLLCVVTEVFMFTFIQFIISFALMEKYKENDYDKQMMVLTWFALFLLFIAFALLGFFISVFITSPKTVYSLSIATVIASYFFSVLSTSNKSLEWLKYLSFFKYSDVVDIISDGGMKTLYIVCYAVVIITCVVLSFVSFKKKRISV